MISRRYLRTKVMQAIFAHEMNPTENIILAEKKLNTSIQDCYRLFLYFFSLFTELKSYHQKRLDELKQKNFPTYEDLHPNTKFLDNKVIAQIENSRTLQIMYRDYKISWPENTELIIQLFRKIAESEEFAAYMQNPERSYEEDKKLLLTIVEKILVPNEFLHWFFEEQNLHWFDDYNEAMLMLYKNLTNFKEKDGDAVRITPLFNLQDPEAEKNFHKELFSKTISHNSEYTEMIESKLRNWDSERIVQTDMILMKMAICELTEFPYIPIKVTINEYLELARWYSSDKSSSFINGVLDKILIELKEQGGLHKTGKGLLNN